MQKLGVKTEAAAYRNLARSVRALGTVQVDERTQRTVAPRFEGWIQKLLVNTTGEAVRRGLRHTWIYFTMSLFTSFGFSMGLYLAAQERQVRWLARPR